MSLGPVMMDIQGTTLSVEDRELLKHPLIGGLIYFARNYESIEQLSALSADIRRVRPDILLAVDQEGGRVQRFKEGFTRLPAMQRFLPLYRRQATSALALVKDCGWLMAVELLAVGVDFSFAPVLDVDDHHSQVIADRAFSNNPDEVTVLAQAFLEGMKQAGMANTGKHFPGHGSVVADSHHELPVDERPYTDIRQKDLVPFQQLSSQLDAIMPAHIVFPKIDDHSVGFSSHWLKNILRGQLNFNGIIFSDDLSMQGAAKIGSYGERALAALRAGCTMVLVCNSREGVVNVLDALSRSDDIHPMPTAIDEDPLGLQRMRAQKQWCFDELINNERYQKTRAILGAIVQ